MVDMPQISPEEANAAKVAVSGGFGAAVHVYLRHPGSTARAVFMVLIGAGMASIFSGITEAWLGWSSSAAGFVVGLCGIRFADKALRMAEQLDLTAFIKRKDG
jgi:hypothetical protein